MVYRAVLTLTSMYMFYNCIQFFLYFNFTSYYTYIVSLNYWDTNLAFCFVLFAVCSCFNLSKYFSIFVVILMTPQNFVSFKLSRSLLDALLVGTITYHPLTLYTAIILFLIKLLFYNSKLVLFLTCHFRLKTNFLIAVTSLFLGSLWSTQSFAWGYFWVNDPVEYLLLLLVFLILHKSHLNKLVFDELYSTIVLVHLVNYLLVIRLNLVTTRHNFITTKQLSFLLLLFWYNGYTVFTNNPLFKKKFVNSQPFMLIGILFLNTKLVILFKYFFFYVLNYYFHLVKRNNIKSLLLHICILNFLVLWVINFNAFFVKFTTSFFNLTLKNFYFEEAISVNLFFFKVTKNLKLLESIFFNSFSISYSVISLASSINLTVTLLNNMFLTLWLLIFL